GGLCPDDRGGGASADRRGAAPRLRGDDRAQAGDQPCLRRGRGPGARPDLPGLRRSRRGHGSLTAGRTFTVTRGGDLLLTAIAPAIWGSTYLVTTELLPQGVPVTVALLRALPAGLLLLLLLRRLPR